MFVLYSEAKDKFPFVDNKGTELNKQNQILAKNVQYFILFTSTSFGH